MAETYEVEVYCSNCGFQDTVEIEKGKEVGEKKCPTCGTTNLERYNPSYAVSK